MEPEYKVVYVGKGILDAEEIRIFLEAAGIPCYANQESIGMSSYSMTVGPIGRAKVYVPSDRYDEAVQLLEKMDRGELETNQDLSNGESVEDDTPDNEIED